MKPQAYYYARNKVLSVEIPGVNGIPTLLQVKMDGKKEAREYCKANGYEIKF